MERVPCCAGGRERASGRGRALHWQSGTNKCTRILLERGENGRWDVKLFCRDTIKRWLESRLLSALKTCACGCLWSCSASALPPTQTVYLLFIFYTPFPGSAIAMQCGSDVHCRNIPVMGVLRAAGYPEMSAEASIHPHFSLLTFFSPRAGYMLLQ